jgi:hypothetical protein
MWMETDPVSERMRSSFLIPDNGPSTESSDSEFLSGCTPGSPLSSSQLHSVGFNIIFPHVSESS